MFHCKTNSLICQYIIDENLVWHKEESVNSNEYTAVEVLGTEIFYVPWQNKYRLIAISFETPINQYRNNPQLICGPNAVRSRQELSKN